MDDASMGADGTLAQAATTLVLSPHVDDGELGAGGTIARLIEEGQDVWYMAFSFADQPRLLTELESAIKVLGIPHKHLITHNFPRRHFLTSRQVVLQQIIDIRDRIKPDLVLTPSLHDIHQDHQVVSAEAVRAFKRTTIWGYELPWNNLVFETRCFMLLEKRHIEVKAQTLKCYESQKHRIYLDESLIWAMAKIRGTQVESQYAEAFEVIRWIL